MEIFWILLGASILVMAFRLEIKVNFSRDAEKMTRKIVQEELQKTEDDLRTRFKRSDEMWANAEELKKKCY